MIKIFCDGSCDQTSGKGGWGVLVRRHNAESNYSGSANNTTNNQMELIAAIKGAVHALDIRVLESEPITIYSDSQYVIKGINEWLDSWKRRGWRTAGKKPVKNRKLWEMLDHINKGLTNVKWTWIKGHAGRSGNVEADQLAVGGRFSKEKEA